MGEGDQVREDQAGVRRATATDRLVVRIPKFATTRGTFRCELRNLRTTSNSMISSAVLNLRFLNELAASYDRNFKFTALVVHNE